MKAKTTMTTNNTKAIQAFRDAAPKTALGLLTAGFELETQKSDGMRKSDLGESNCDCEPELDDEAMSEQLANDVSEIADDAGLAMRDYARCFDEAWLKTLQRAPFSQRNEFARSLTVILGISSVEDMEAAGLIASASDFEENLRAYLEENQDPIYLEIEHNCSDQEPDDYFKDKFDLPNVEVVEDATVRGFEFRTVGGLSVAQFKKAAAAVFEIDHDIDTQCSFHIHLAVAGVKHVYGRHMQQAITEYMLDHIADVPATVRARWTKVKTWTYFKPGMTEDKYSFVHKHRQGTWEFRCFGNVQNAADAQICLELAVKAMQHAYSRKKTYAEAFKIPLPMWIDCCERAMIDGRALSDVIAEYRDDQSA